MQSRGGGGTAGLVTGVGVVGGHGRLGWPGGGMPGQVCLWVGAQAATAWWLRGPGRA